MFRVRFLVLTFILKLLSRGSFISRLRRNYGQHVVSLIHRVDRLTHRYVKLSNDIYFLSKCIQLRVTPSFVRFKTVNSRLGLSTAYTKAQRLLLRDELRNKHRERNKISLQVNSVKSDIFSILRPLDSLLVRFDYGSLFLRTNLMILFAKCMNRNFVNYRPIFVSNR